MDCNGAGKPVTLRCGGSPFQIHKYHTCWLNTNPGELIVPNGTHDKGLQLTLQRTQLKCEFVLYSVWKIKRLKTLTILRIKLPSCNICQK